MTQTVSLTKGQPTVSLTKGSGATGTMRVNLNWTAGGHKGMFGKTKGGIDLDLGALYELADGTKGVVQALGNSFGSTDRAPYVKLDGDDRSGANTDGENLLVNLDHLGQIKRVLVFAYIYEGAAQFDKADGVVTLYPVGGQPVQVILDGQGGRSKMCAVALLTPENGGLARSSTSTGSTTHSTGRTAGA